MTENWNNRRSKKPPQKPTNLRPCDYRIRINWQRFTKLEISPYYEKHNKEFLEALEKRGIILSKAELSMEREEAAKALDKAKEWRERQ